MRHSLNLHPLCTPHHNPVFMLVLEDYSNFLSDAVSVFGGHQEALDGITSVEMDLGLHFATKVFDAFT